MIYQKYIKSLSVWLLIMILNSTFVFCQVAPGRSKKLKTYAVSGKVTLTSSYCGGAAPSQELLERLATPVPYEAKKFHIRRGKTNSTKIKIIKSFTTDSKGEFCIRLLPGTYAIILEEQLHSIKAADFASDTQQVDAECLKNWWEKPYYLLIVGDTDITQLNFNFYRRCFISSDIPCISYQGPLPP